MEQHAIPQQISSYEFKLVGEMTLKQFLKAAAGIVLAIMINASKLIFIIKYPLMFLVAGGGLALAFVPFQDRPLEQWIAAFLKSVYSPTIYIYRKKGQKNWLNLKALSAEEKQLAEKEAEEEEVKRKIILAETKKTKGKLLEFVTSLPEKEADVIGNTINDIREDKEKNVISNTIKDISKTENKDVIGNTINDISKAEEKQTVELGLKKEKLEATGEAVFGAIPMPDKPEVANILVGMVTDNQGKIIEGAIVEIQDEKGNPTRVLKTNLLGQFRTTTPMANGKYLVIVEKDNFKFDRVQILIEGKIIDPIKIQSA
ncbi:MAG TPA: PrgI family protein [Candidatus Woesebacteria bacterium]|nr:PrgI family protein [Candidatus Woesebacteria bacterium]HPJ17341.1 PrgI family protein [Candidatus Woesebacteria bacterium]